MFLQTIYLSELQQIMMNMMKFVVQLEVQAMEQQMLLPPYLVDRLSQMILTQKKLSLISILYQMEITQEYQYILRRT